MTIDRTRRALLAAVLGGGLAASAVSPARSYLYQFAPLSGSAWRSATRDVSGTVESTYGSAEVRYDDYGVPHIEAEDDLACYFAVGYVQAADRLFGMDVQRRLFGGTLAAAFGERAVESDEFHRKMDFRGAAAATWEHLEGTETGDVVSAYVDGVNACIDEEALPVEFELLEYEPEPWTPTDSMLMEKQISWGLTGSFRTLRLAVVAEKLGEDVVEQLYPAWLDHDYPILRDGGDSTGSNGATSKRIGPADGIGTGLLDWLGEFETDPGIGSNSWVVSGEHTASGKPLLANDPHLLLTVPPLWYEQRLRTDEMEVKGVTFPGVPFVVIGENHAGAWGFTNVGADVIDFYSYETDGDRYQYRGEWHDFETETQTIQVADADDREVEVKKTVHGPYLEREGQQVGVAWTGLTATETTVAVHEYAHSDGLDDFLAATRKFDLPTQNVVYADRDGRTAYYTIGRIPIRTVDGERVRGDRIFDGSAGEAEWDGFEPYGVSSWEGFRDFEEKPHAIDPDYVGTANQRVVDGDPDLAEAYGAPYRGRRVYDLLDGALEDGGTVDGEFMREMQRDTHDGRAADLASEILAARLRMDDRARRAADELDGWNFRMNRYSRAALVFARWFDHFRAATFEPEFEAAGLDSSYYPSDWVLAHLPADSEWFGGDRAAIVARAMNQAASEIDEKGWETYGDYNQVTLTHPFELDFLNYPELPADGSPYSLQNVRVESDVGSSWRMVASLDDQVSQGIIPGGNSGDPFSEHYHDQLRAWADGEYRNLSWDADGSPDVAFEGGDQ